MKNNKKAILFVALFMSICCFFATVPPVTGRAAGGLKLNALFTDNMVLQRNQKVKISGIASAGETITVTFKGQKKTCVADANGDFVVYLDEMEADKTGASLVVSGKTQMKTLRNVLVGEVFYGSGQSNMAYPLDEFDYAESVIKNNPSYAEDYEKYNSRESFLEKFKQFTKYGMTRFYMTKMLPITNGVVNKGTTNAWIAPSGIGELQFVSFTAIAFAVNIVEKLDVPVGIIVAGVGGSQIHEWISRESAAAIYPGNNDSSLCRRYENMLLPLGSYTVKAVLWYQGESDVYNSTKYKDCFNAWLKETREFFDDENLPVITFMLPQFEDEYCKGLWADFRQIQLELANECQGVYYINGIDLGDHRNIHPTDKYELCERAVGLALKYIYQLDYSGSGSYGKNPEVSALYRKEDTNVVYATFSEAKSISVSKGVTRGLKVSSNKKSYIDVASFEQVGSTMVRFNSKYKYASYLQNNIFDYDTAFIYNEYGLPVAPFVNIPVTEYEFDVEVQYTGCSVNAERFFVKNGDTVTLKVTADEGKKLENFTVNGETVELNENGELEIANINEDIIVCIAYESEKIDPPDDSSNIPDSSNNNSSNIDSSSTTQPDSSSSSITSVEDNNSKSCKSSLGLSGIACVSALAAVAIYSLKKRK